MIKTKRVYESPAKEDGYRILVDRLWPRGLSKEKIKVEQWTREVAPSDALRAWFSHDPKKWAEFKKRYKEELKDKADPLDKLKAIATDHKVVTFVYAAKDQQHNNAVALKEILENL